MSDTSAVPPAHSQPATVSVASATEVYDASQRELATRHGGATARASYSLAQPADNPAATVWVDDDDRVMCRTPERGDVRLNGGLVARLVDAFVEEAQGQSRPRPILFADTATLLRTAAATRKQALRGKPGVAKAARFLTVRTGLATSFLLPVATQAVGHRFYSPADTPDTVDSWLRALDLPVDDTVPDQVARLLNKAATGMTPPTRSAMVGAETAALRFGQWSSLSSACVSFSAAGKLYELHQAVINLDPALRERNVAAGTLAVLQVRTVRPRRVEAVLTHPGKIRVDSTLTAFDSAGASGMFMLSDIEFSGRHLVAVLTPRKGGLDLAESALSAGETLWGCESPFASQQKRATHRRWLDQGQVGTRGRQIDLPLELATATPHIGDDFGTVTV